MAARDSARVPLTARRALGERAKQMTVLIAGGGIAGLTLGLTLHQISIPFHIFETTRAPKPLGVGINLQPPAVRELFALGLEDMLDEVGIQTRDYGFYTRTGQEIWTEPRGCHAGYNWPQYSVHRGRLQMALLDALRTRCGDSCITFGARVRRYETRCDRVTVHYEVQGSDKTASADMLIGADGIHSGVRAQMYPTEGPPVWGGAIMWRGTSLAKPFLTGQSMILAGNNTQRFVSYPISAPDGVTGLSQINWIAEKTVDPTTHFEKEDWNRRVDVNQFASDFSDWDFGWIDVPSLIAAATEVFEYPMVDREPVPRWTDGPVVLIGDAAHATYPVGSSGATQAILDTRILAAELRGHGLGSAAASAFEARVLPMANRVTLGNRGNGGPDAIMQIAEDRCKGDFTVLDRALPYDERAAHSASFKKLAGLSLEATNNAPALL
jgi:2-polyprenyl-6-methoxyphenol hydroxylase-like FAD-dependent oxidoreductase